MIVKILKVLGIIASVLALAAFGFWFTMLRAPSTEEQCAHVLSLMDQKMAGFSTSPPGQQWLTECPDKMGKGELQGQVSYAKQAKCLMAATSIEAVDSCR